MASPQTEKGYTKIANELLDELVATHLPASEKSMMFFIIRKTYGYGKRADYISLTQFQKGLRYSRPVVCKALKNLVNRKMVVKTQLLAISIEKDYEKWVVNTPLLVKSRNNLVKTQLPKLVKTQLHTKEKRNITKEITQLLAAEGDQMFDSKKFITKLINDPKRHIHIIGIYYQFREETWPGIDAVKFLMGREFRPAVALKEYTDEQIIKTMEFLNQRVRQNKLEKWTLATVINYIGEVVNGKV